MPDDFRQTERSVWVDIPSRLFDPKVSNRVYNEYMDQLEYAESVGFDGIGVNEHHQNGYGIMPSPNIIAAGLARRTSRAAICVIGNSIALYNPPVRVAEEFAMLDCISGGRLSRLPGRHDGPNSATARSPRHVTSTGGPRADHEGVVRARAARSTASTRSCATLSGRRSSSRTADLHPGRRLDRTWTSASTTTTTTYLSFGGYLAGKKLLDGYWERVAERDKDDSPYRAAFAQIIAVADTDAEAEKLYAEHILYFFNRCLHVYPGFSDPPGYRTISTIKAGVLDQFRAEMREKFTKLTWKDLVDGGFVIAGGPDTVRERMEDMITSLRLGHVFCLMHNGNQPDRKTRYSTQLFAEKVMPSLRNMWPEHEGDDRWWIHPYEERVHADETFADARRHADIPQ